MLSKSDGVRGVMETVTAVLAVRTAPRFPTPALPPNYSRFVRAAPSTPPSAAAYAPNLMVTDATRHEIYASAT